ncbi:GGDEF domain-containing protein [Jeongeupia naejangsanensis]|uniref:diguanylate cyclase n=1 Tax=Jeongeupia naejangsanensis TaxID=613195 RepID=A0ABS2BGN0_9NEIS|nr:GGDEF domain-containing protein [Jeongeupia naejangsanensis]MBM3114751.1 GGDEF domain-containing protein [Jeongeupia naejangsanensis]
MDLESGLDQTGYGRISRFCYRYRLSLLISGILFIVGMTLVASAATVFSSMQRTFDKPASIVGYHSARLSSVWERFNSVVETRLPNSRDGTLLPYQNTEELLMLQLDLIEASYRRAALLPLHLAHMQQYRGKLERVLQQLRTLILHGDNTVATRTRVRGLLEEGGQLVNLISLETSNAITKADDAQRNLLVEAGHFTLILLAVLVTLGAVLAGAFIVVLTQRRALKMLAMTDGLTGLANRRVFMQQLEAEHTRALRYALPTSLILIDLDHFKAINDNWGHPGGDTVLKAVSATLQTMSRQSDLVARIGGEEFAILMPETTLAAATDAATRYCEAVAAMTVQHGHHSLGVTASFGVATMRHDTNPAASATFAQADAALYRAKHCGRNRVIAAPVLSLSPELGGSVYSVSSDISPTF